MQHNHLESSTLIVPYHNRTQPSPEMDIPEDTNNLSGSSGQKVRTVYLVYSLLDISWLGLFNKRQTLHFQHRSHIMRAYSISTEAACHIIGLHSVNCRSCRWENVSPRISGILATWSTTCISCSWVIYDHEFNAKEEIHHILSSLFHHIEHACFSLHFQNPLSYWFQQVSCILVQCTFIL